MSDLEYRASLARQIQDAIKAPLRAEDRVTIPSVCAFGVVQFLFSHEAIMRDAERLDRLDSAGKQWRVVVGSEVLGAGRIREAIDQALRRFPRTDESGNQ